MSVLVKLNQVQVELRAPKGNVNNFGGYKYRKAEDILEAVKPLLRKAGAVVTISDDIVQFGDRFYIKSTATFSDIVDGSSHSVSAFAREALTKKGMDDAQVTGAASSYARKYALCGLLAIDDSSNDPDATNRHGKDEPAPAPAKPSPTKSAPVKSELAKEAWRQFKALDEVKKMDEVTRNSAWAKLIMDAARKVAPNLCTDDDWEKILTEIDNRRAI